jgi:hypothetical protein
MAYKSLGVPIRYDDAKLIVKRLDHDRDGLLSYTEVCDIFMPKDVIVRNSFINRNEGSTNDINPKYIPHVRSIFMQFLSLEKKTEHEKSTLTANTNFRLTAAFDIINRINETSDEKVTTVELKKLLEQ